MKRLIFAIATAVCLLAGLRAESLPNRGEQVVKQAIAALGGDKFLGVQDVTESGRVYGFYGGRMTGLAVARIYTRFLDEPTDAGKPFTQIEERLSFGKKGEDYAYLYEEGHGYEITFHGVRRIAPEKVFRNFENKRQDVFTILRLRLKEPGMTIISRGSDIVDNQSVETVEFVDNENRSTIVHFSMATKLPLRETWTWREKDTNLPNEESAIFSKYRDVDGVMWPYVIQRRKNGEKSFEKYAESVKINQNLDDSLFRIAPDTNIEDPI